MKIKLKRMTSLMLAVLMVCGMFPMPSFAAEEADLTPPSAIYGKDGLVDKNADKNTTLSDGQVILTKEAKPTSVPNQYEITLTVRGKGAKTTTPGADIVLVMDKSGSMGDRGMRALKNAAEAFIDIVLAEGKSNRVSLVEYSTNATTATDFYTSAQRATAKGKIPTNDGGGTNTQMGLYKARAKLAESKASKKFVVLISDGEPTFNAIPIINAQWTGSRNDNKSNYNTCDYSGYGDFRWYGAKGSGRWEAVDSSKDMNAIVGYDYTMYTGDGDDSNYNGYVLGVLKSDPTKTVVNGTKRNISSATAAINEAGYIKAAGTEIYTVAYNANNTAQSVLRNIASSATGKTYTYTTNSDLTDVFKSIGESIEQEVSGGVTDPMGSFIDIGTPTVSGTLSNKGNYKVSNGTISFEGNTFTWSPNVSENEESTLSYIVELDVEAEGFIQNEVYKTNGTTTMEYTIGETQKTGQFNVPSVTGTYSQVYRIGYRVNEDNQYIDANGNVVEKTEAVIFALDPVGNPDAEGRNQWKEGRNTTVDAFADTDEYELTGENTVDINNMDGVQTYVAEFNYVVKQYEYTVEYYVDGVHQDWDETGKAPLNAVIETYENKCPTGYKLQKEENLPLTITTGENVIKIYYVKDNFNYTVNYYYDGKMDESKTEEKSAAYGDVIETYTDKPEEGYKFDKTENLPLTVSEKAENNVINVYYVKDNYGYTIRYHYDGIHDENADVTGSAEFGSTINEYPDKIKTGYRLDKTEGFPMTIKTSGNIADVYYVRDDFGYTVEYYYDNVIDNGATESGTAKFGEKIETYTDKIKPGYKLVGTEKLPLTISANASENVIKVYYAKDTYSYTVNYYKDSIAPDNLFETETGSAEFGTEIPYHVAENVPTGYKTEATVENVGDGKVTADPEKNIVNVIYVKDSFAYTVEYYYDGVKDDSKTDSFTAEYESVVETYEDKNITGYIWEKDNAPLTISANASENVIRVYYVRGNFGYTVNYYYDGQMDPSRTENLTAKFADVIKTYTDKNKTGYKLDRVDGIPLTISANASENVINVYYVKDSFGYTVEYYYDNVKDDSKTERIEAVFGETINNYTDKVKTGYVFEKTVGTPLTITEIAENNVIKVYYVRDNFGYTVKYYYDGVCDETKTETGTAKFEDVISQYTDKVIEGYVFQTKENMPLTITADESENVAHIYYVKRADLGYTVKYLEKDTFEALAQDKTGSGKTFGEYVTENAIAITGYKLAEGEAVEKSIAITTGENEIVFLYEKDSYPYIVNYYKDSVEEGNFINSKDGAAKLYGTQLDADIVTADLREGWLNAFLPAGYLAAEGIEGAYPVINVEGNVINVVYRRSNALQYTVNYYKDSIAEANLLGSDVTNNVTLGDMVYPDTYPVPMMAISLYTFEVFKYLPAGYAEEADIENAPLTVGANVSENVINVIYTTHKSGSLTINKTVADIEKEEIGTEFHFKVTYPDESVEYVSTVITENEGEKAIAPVVLTDLAWGKYTVTEVILSNGEYIEDLTYFDYIVSGEGDVHVGGENYNAEIDIINTRREGGSLVINKVAEGDFDPEAVYEFALYLSHMRYNEVTDGNIEAAQAELDALTAALLEAETFRDTKKAEYDAIMAEVVNAEANLALAKKPIEEAMLELEMAIAEKAAAEESLKALNEQLEKATDAVAPVEPALVEAPAEEEVAEPEIPSEPTAPVAPVAPTQPIAPTKPTDPGEFTGTAPNPPSQPTVEEGADEETVAKALADYETAYAAYETALDAFEAEKTAHEALVAQYNADAAAYEGAKAAYDAEMTVYNADYAKYEEDLNAYNASEEVAAYNTAKAEYDTAMVAYNEAKAAYDAYMAKVTAYEAYVAAKAKYEEDLAAFNALKASIEGLEAQKAEAEAILAEKNTAVTEKQTALEDVTEAQATPIKEAEKALEEAKALANEKGSEAALAALENAEKAALDAENAKAEAEEALRHLKSANDPTMRSADEVILVENEALTPIVENDVVIGYTFFLKSGESLVLTDLPADAVYEVIEVDNGGADATFTGEELTNEASGLVDMENGTAVTFTNVFEYDKTITVTKSYSGNVYNGTVVIDIYMVTENGDVLVDTVRIAGNGSETIVVDALGEYKAVEREVENYYASYGENAVLTEDNINGTLTVVNTYEPPYVPDPPQPPVNDDNYYKVTVVYINEETGEEIYGRYTTGSMIEGSEYDVSGETMVEIEGFEQTGVEGEVAGVLNNDVTVIVYYAPFEEIIEEEVPLAPPEEEIIEEDIPLTDLPKTGGVSGIGFCMIGLAAIAAGTMLKRKEEDED
ncbi:MAG: VWA domain-containing protein [Clostridia bacterium]|nr:VWA domain-containing protein [Clostridia bacterium]